MRFLPTVEMTAKRVKGATRVDIAEVIEKLGRYKQLLRKQIKFDQLILGSSGLSVLSAENSHLASLYRAD